MPARKAKAVSGNFPMLLDPILKTILTEIPGDAAGVYSVTDQSWLAAVARIPGSLPQTLPALESSDPVVLSETELAGSTFASALLFPLLIDDEMTAVLAVFSSAAYPYSAKDAKKLKAWSYPLIALLENQRLREQRDMADKVRAAVNLMSDVSLPQDVVDRLHPLNPRVSTCALMLYGPLREDMPSGPFEYLEVRGTWSKRRGSGIGVSYRIFLDSNPFLLDELNEKRVIVVDDIKSVEPYLGSLTLGFLRAEHVRSAIMLTIGTPQWPIGTLMIATDEPTPFTPQEVSTYQAIGELVTLNGLTRLLQHHRDLVQQGRTALLDAVTDGVVIVAPAVAGQSSQEGFVSGINKAFGDLFSIVPQDAKGLSLSALLTHMRLPDDKTTMLLQEWSKIQVWNPSVQRGEFEMPGRDGDTVNMEWYSAPVYQDTRVLGRIYIFHDASAEHTAERLRANFIQRLSHELRTPLSSIQGYAQLLLDQARLEEHQHGHVQTIFDNALHLNQMFTDVILMARADNRELRLQKEFTLISDLIHTTARMLEEKAVARGLSVEFVLDEGLPYVYIDSHYVSKVLEEVLRNAVLYAPPNTTIRITASHVNDANQFPHGAPADFHLVPGILLTVADEGFGFSVTEAEEVFVPFHRGKNATSAKIPGTGLGLTIARSLIELHRGKIWAEARKRGKFATRFHFILPAIEPEENV